MKRAVATSNFDLRLQTSSAGVADRGYAVQSAFCQLLHFVRGAIGETHLFCLQGVADTVCRPAMVEVRGRDYSAQAELFEMTGLLQLRKQSFSVKGEKLTA